MEEDKIKELFSSYDPELSSSLAFIERLERNLNAVEIIHKENEAVMNRNKVAVAAAALAGFLSGMIFSLILPYLTIIFRTIFESIPGVNGQDLPGGYLQVASWIFVGAVSVFVAVNTYDITLSLQPSKGVRREG
ncbi:MAG: hypothetical protein K2N48_14200 [Muribaculaceae bacterium]|nr:hypothetical protein [Muribaculaceae bacterium]